MPRPSHGRLCGRRGPRSLLLPTWAIPIGMLENPKGVPMKHRRQQCGPPGCSVRGRPCEPLRRSWRNRISHHQGRNRVILTSDAHTQIDARNHPSCHRRLSTIQTSDRRPDCRTSCDAPRWSYRASRHARSPNRQTSEDQCSRPKAHEGRPTAALGQDPRRSRIAVIGRHAGAHKTETQAECCWQGRNRRRIEETVGSEEGGGAEIVTTRGRESHCEEGSGEGYQESYREEATKEESKSFRTASNVHGPVDRGPAAIHLLQHLKTRTDTAHRSGPTTMAGWQAATSQASFQPLRWLSTRPRCAPWNTHMHPAGRVSSWCFKACSEGCRVTGLQKAPTCWEQLASSPP